MSRLIGAVGTYTQKEAHVIGKGAGILIYSIGSKRTDWELSAVYSDIVNPSYLCFSPVQPLLYAVSEQSGFGQQPAGRVQVIRIGMSGQSPQLIQSIDSRGDAPCYISVCSQGRYVWVAHYATGNITAYATNAQGELTYLNTLYSEGSGPHPRQVGPHAHYVQPHPQDDTLIYGIDLGSDRLMRYKMENRLRYLDDLMIEKGSGPRHLVWGISGRECYIFNELSGTVSHWFWHGADQEKRGVLSLVSPNDEAEAGAANLAISADGRFIYAALRGRWHEIVVLAVNPNDQSLSIIQRVPAGGLVPRHCTLLPAGSHLVVALQDSDCVALLARDERTGRLSAAETYVAVRSPACSAFYSVS